MPSTPGSARRQPWTQSALRLALGAQAARREQGGDPFCSRSLASSGGDNTVATSLGAGHHGFGCDLGGRPGEAPRGPSGEAVAGGGVSQPAQEAPGPSCWPVEASTQKRVGGWGLCHSCPHSSSDATGLPQGAWCMGTFGVLSEPGDGQGSVPPRKAVTHDGSSSACGQAAISLLSPVKIMT